jgi:hypothetical protein
MMALLNATNSVMNFEGGLAIAFTIDKQEPLPVEGKAKTRARYRAWCELAGERVQGPAWEETQLGAREALFQELMTRHHTRLARMRADREKLARWNAGAARGGGG